MLPNRQETKKLSKIISTPNFIKALESRLDPASYARLVFANLINKKFLEAHFLIREEDDAVFLLDQLNAVILAAKNNFTGSLHENLETIVITIGILTSLVLDLHNDEKLNAGVTKATEVCDESFAELKEVYEAFWRFDDETSAESNRAFAVLDIFSNLHNLATQNRHASSEEKVKHLNDLRQPLLVALNITTLDDCLDNSKFNFDSICDVLSLAQCVQSVDNFTIENLDVHVKHLRNVIINNSRLISFVTSPMLFSERRDEISKMTFALVKSLSLIENLYENIKQYDFDSKSELASAAVFSPSK